MLALEPCSLTRLLEPSAANVARAATCDHCPACRQISPILQQLASEYAGRLTIVKMLAADNPSTSTKLGVRAMPTILAFAKGKVVGQLVGARPKAAFTELIERALKAA